MWNRTPPGAKSGATARCGVDLLAFHRVTDRLEASRRSWADALATIGAMLVSPAPLQDVIDENTDCWTALLCGLEDCVVDGDPEVARLNRLLSQLANRAIYYGRIASSRIECVDMLIDINQTLLAGLRPLAGDTGKVWISTPRTPPPAIA